MTKKYEVRGMMEWHPEFRVGRSRIQISFTGGHLCGGAATPARYETSDPVVQAVIETSRAFLTGRIRLSGECAAFPSSIPVAGSARKTAAAMASAIHDSPDTKAANIARDTNITMEFSNLDSASDFLQQDKGIPLDRVLTLEQCLAEAKTIGIDLIIKKSDTQ